MSVRGPSTVIVMEMTLGGTWTVMGSEKPFVSWYSCSSRRTATPLSSKLGGLSGLLALLPGLLLPGWLLAVGLFESSTIIASLAGSSLQPAVSAKINKHIGRRIRCFFRPDTGLPRKNRECG